MDLHRKEGKKQDLLSKLGVWRSQERVEGEGGEQRKMYSSVRTIKKKNKQKGVYCVLFLKCYCMCVSCVQAGVTLHAV